MILIVDVWIVKVDSNEWKNFRFPLVKEKEDEHIAQDSGISGERSISMIVPSPLQKNKTGGKDICNGKFSGLRACHEKAAHVPKGG